MLKDKNILITGATSGIGREIALKLMAEAANCAMCGRSKTKMEHLINDSAEFNSKKYFETFDIRDDDKIFSFITKSKEVLGEIDILINCAGINSERADVENISVSELRKMIDVNFVAPFLFIQNIYKDMINKKDGMIINVMSTVCNFSNEGIAAYTASKAGFDGLAKVLRKEARNHNVQICSIYPGGVDTDFREASRPQYLNPEIVADSVVSMIKLNSNSCVDELTIRPMVETNF
jgi:NADP-dependent 3-hydroxy acid dehydrogenase YdfG